MRFYSRESIANHCAYIALRWYYRMMHARESNMLWHTWRIVFRVSRRTSWQTALQRCVKNHKEESDRGTWPRFHLRVIKIWIHTYTFLRYRNCGFNFDHRISLLLTACFLLDIIWSLHKMRRISSRKCSLTYFKKDYFLYTYVKLLSLQISYNVIPSVMMLYILIHIGYFGIF